MERFSEPGNGCSWWLFGLPMCVVLLVACGACPAACAADWRQLARPVVEGKWLRPAAGGAAQPVWGHADGLCVGLYPLRGPRGLLRIYTPYLDHAEGRVINYIAVEPIVRGDDARGLSELERSELDDTRGKRFWSADNVDSRSPRPPEHPARGWIEQRDDVECLCVFVLVERFESGAHVYLRLTFRADRPEEVGIATYSHRDSKPLEHCIVTATMGNFARLRKLHLGDRQVLSTELWPEYDGLGFTPHARFALEELLRTPTGGAVVHATPNETRPQAAQYAAGTSRHWHYVGEKATQSWRSESPDPRLAVLVNGRYAYWGSTAPIPGGVSFENFEMLAPFREGGEYWFGVAPGLLE